MRCGSMSRNASATARSTAGCTNSLLERLSPVRRFFTQGSTRNADRRTYGRNQSTVPGGTCAPSFSIIARISLMLATSNRADIYSYVQGGGENEDRRQEGRQVAPVGTGGEGEPTG